MPFGISNCCLPLQVALGQAALKGTPQAKALWWNMILWGNEVAQYDESKDCKSEVIPYEARKQPVAGWLKDPWMPTTEVLLFSPNCCCFHVAHLSGWHRCCLCQRLSFQSPSPSQLRHLIAHEIISSLGSRVRLSPCRTAPSSIAAYGPSSFVLVGINTVAC